MKKTKIKLWTGSIWEEVFPETDARLVHLNKESSDNLDHWATKTDNSIEELHAKHEEQASEISEAIALADEAKTLALGAVGSSVYPHYTQMCEDLNNNIGNTALNVGQHILIIQLNIPDLWVSGVLSEYHKYEYTDDANFLEDLSENGYVDVGWYKLSALETQKVDLKDYVKFNADGTIYTGTPTESGHAATKGYVDDNFVAKYNRTAGEARMWFVYVQNQEGVDKVLQLDNTTKSRQATIPFRDHRGCLAGIGTPQNDDDAANKKYVDDNFVPIFNAAADYSRVYMIDRNGNQTVYPIADGNASGASQLVHYYANDTSYGDVLTNNPVLLTGMPQKDYHATPKKYVDSLLAGASGGGSNTIFKVIDLSDGSNYNLCTDMESGDYEIEISVFVNGGDIFQPFELLAHNGASSMVSHATRIRMLARVVGEDLLIYGRAQVTTYIENEIVVSEQGGFMQNDFASNTTIAPSSLGVDAPQSMAKYYVKYTKI